MSLVRLRAAREAEEVPVAGTSLDAVTRGSRDAGLGATNRTHAGGQTKKSGPSVVIHEAIITRRNSRR